MATTLQTTECEAFASHAVTVQLGEQSISATVLTGLGSVNRIVVVTTNRRRVVVRLRPDPDAKVRREYEKEAWCLAHAAAAGIRVPRVLATGQEDGIAYLIETYAQGLRGEDAALDSNEVWFALGRLMKSVHAVPAAGFGEELADSATGRFQSPLHDGYDGTWPGFVQYNIDCLRETDPLLALCVYTRAEADAIRGRWADLKVYPFSFGLNHGDLAPRNVIVTNAKDASDETGVYLLDWGSAEVHVVPGWDIVQVLQSALFEGNPGPDQILSFIDGYGLTQAECADLQPILHSLMLLRSFDKLRWAIDRSPTDIPVFTRRARAVLGHVNRAACPRE